MTDEHNEDFHDGFVGVSRVELEVMPDSELAQWQYNHKNDPPLVTLAEREWERRIISHQLTVQYDLDSRLAKAAEAHVERLAESNRWWGFAGALLGVIGTLSGVGLARWLEPPCQGTKEIPQSQSPLQTEKSALSNSATSAVSSTTSQSAQKTK